MKQIQIVLLRLLAREGQGLSVDELIADYEQERPPQKHSAEDRNGGSVIVLSPPRNSFLRELEELRTSGDVVRNYTGEKGRFVVFKITSRGREKVITREERKKREEVRGIRAWGRVLLERLRTRKK
jgi:hypothetical protein